METNALQVSQYTWMLRADVRDRASGMVEKINMHAAAADEEVVALLRVIESQLSSLDAALTALHLTARRRLDASRDASAEQVTS